MRIATPDGGTMPETLDDLEPGDFIGSRSCSLIVGSFFGRGDVANLKNAYLIHQANGQHALIEDGDAYILGWGR